MSGTDREVAETVLREQLAAGAHATVAHGIVRAYGPEIAGFLHATLRDETAADEVFSGFCEAVVRGLPSFRGQASFRTWAYTLARNAAHQHRVAARRRRAREQGQDSDPDMDRVVAEVRTATARFLKTEVKSKLTQLRDTLPEEDRMLLVLRVDKRLGFDEIARVMHDGSEDELTDAEVKRAAAKYRKRFQAVKERLVELGKKEGLLGVDE